MPIEINGNLYTQISTVKLLTNLYSLVIKKQIIQKKIVNEINFFLIIICILI